MIESNFDRGMRLIQQLGGRERPAVLELFESLDLGAFGEECVAFVYGNVYHRKGLALPERQLATLGALTALGYASAQLRFHAQAALNVGCSQRQIIESIVQASSIVGFAATLNALTTVREAIAGTEICTRPYLDLKRREIVSVAACTALGSVPPQLRLHIHGLLDVGGTRQEVVETLVHVAFYAGFPAALNALATAREVFAERATA